MYGRTILIALRCLGQTGRTIFGRCADAPSAAGDQQDEQRHHPADCTRSVWWRRHGEASHAWVSRHRLKDAHPDRRLVAVRRLNDARPVQHGVEIKARPCSRSVAGRMHLLTGRVSGRLVTTVIFPLFVIRRPISDETESSTRLPRFERPLAKAVKFRESYLVQKD